MINLWHIRDLVIRPTLLALDAVDRGQYSLSAEQLLLGTLVTESGGKHIAQIGGGPAMGPWQVEPDTDDDLWETRLNYRAELANCIRGFLAETPSRHMQLATNGCYSVAMARQVYRRSPDALPEPGDIQGMGEMWAAVYNTANGAGEVSDFTRKYTNLVERLYR